MYILTGHFKICYIFFSFFISPCVSENNSKNCIAKSDKDISFLKNQEKAPKRFGGNWKSNDDNYKKTSKSQRYLCSSTDPDLLCGVIFVDKGFTAKVLFYLLSVCI